MLTLLIKILLAVFACVTAVLGVSDLKSVSESDGSTPWLRRITKAGVIKIVCALATLLLIAANEYLTYAGEAKASAKTEQTAQGLQSQLAEALSKLDEARSALGASIMEIGRLSTNNGYLIRALDGSLRRAGTAKISTNEIDSPDLPLRFREGGDVIPQNGDVIEWVFDCSAGSLPPVPTSQESSSCSSIAYGRLMANGAQIRLGATAGKRTFFGTRSRGGQLAYRSPSENGECPTAAAQMKAARCELEITVMTETRWFFEKLATTASQPTNHSIATAAQDACRRYEALYGESCEDAVRKLNNR